MAGMGIYINRIPGVGRVREHASPRPRLRCGAGDDRIEGKMIEKAGFPFRLC